jgi:hypothetical protein
MWAHSSVPDDSSPYTDGEADLMLMFVDSMRIIPCPEMTVVDVEHTLTYKSCLSVHTVLCKTKVCIDYYSAVGVIDLPDQYTQAYSMMKKRIKSSFRRYSAIC